MLIDRFYTEISALHSAWVLQIFLELLERYYCGSRDILNMCAIIDNNSYFSSLKIKMEMFLQVLER